MLLVLTIVAEDTVERRFTKPPTRKATSSTTRRQAAAVVGKPGLALNDCYAGGPAAVPS